MAETFEKLEKMDTPKLHEALVVQKKNLMNLRFQKTSGQLEKTHGIRIARRTVARIKTLLAMQARKEKGNA